MKGNPFHIAHTTHPTTTTHPPRVALDLAKAIEQRQQCGGRSGARAGDAISHRGPAHREKTDRFLASSAYLHLRRKSSSHFFFTVGRQGRRASRTAVHEGTYATDAYYRGSDGGRRAAGAQRVQRRWRGLTKIGGGSPLNDFSLRKKMSDMPGRERARYTGDDGPT